MRALLVAVFIYTSSLVTSKKFNFQDCGRRYDTNRYEPVITYGNNTVFSQFPWHVAIFKEDKGVGKYVCGGTIIHPDIILTVAHGFYDERTKKVDNGNFIVAAGKYNNSWTTMDPNERRFKVTEIQFPESYLGQIKLFQSDIALLALNESITFNTVIRPICVDWKTEFSLHQHTGHGTLVGWGLTEKETLSEKLMSIQLNYYNLTYCKDEIFPSEDFSLYLTSDKFCGGREDDASVQHGDSGGGFINSRNTSDGDQFFLYGILTGRDNEGTVSSFTDLGYHMDWLNSTVHAILEGRKERTACGKTFQFNYTDASGRTTNITTYPWLSVIYGEFDFIPNEILVVSAGSIIHPKAILTVGSRMPKSDSPESEKLLGVALGKYNNSWYAKDPLEKRFKVAKVHINPLVDLAILELEEEIKFNASVQPVCIDWKNELKLDTLPSPLGTVVGWNHDYDCKKCQFPEVGYYTYGDFKKCKKVIIDDNVFSGWDMKFAHNQLCGDYVNGSRVETSYGASFTLTATSPEGTTGDHFLYGIMWEKKNNGLLENSTTILTFANVIRSLDWIHSILDSIDMNS